MSVHTRLRISVSIKPDQHVVVELFGELAYGSDDVLLGLIDAAASVGRSSIKLDLSNVTFIDLHGLDALLAASERAKAAGTVLEVAPAQRVLELLVLTGTDDLFVIEPSSPLDDLRLGRRTA